MSGMFVAARLLPVMLVLGLSACVETAGLERSYGAGQPSPSGSDAARGAAALATGDVQSADRAYSTALRRRPEDPAVLLGMAETQLAKGALDKSAELFAMADRSAGRSSARSLQGQGLIALRSGNLGDAVDSLEAAVSADSSLWRAWIGLARSHLAYGERGKATDALLKAELISSTNASALNDIGMVYLSDRAPTRALDYFVRALEVDPGHPAARSNIRIARAMLGNYDAAVSGASPEGVADALNNAGYAAILNGAYETAERLLRRALEVSPVYHAAARANLELLNQATAGTKTRSRQGAPASAASGDKGPVAEANAIRRRMTNLTRAAAPPPVPTPYYDPTQPEPGADVQRAFAVKTDEPAPQSKALAMAVATKEEMAASYAAAYAVNLKGPKEIRADGYRWVSN